MDGDGYRILLCDHCAAYRSVAPEAERFVCHQCGEARDIAPRVAQPIRTYLASPGESAAPSCPECRARLPISQDGVAVCAYCGTQVLLSTHRGGERERIALLRHQDPEVGRDIPKHLVYLISSHGGAALLNPDFEGDAQREWNQTIVELRARESYSREERLMVLYGLLKPFYSNSDRWRERAILESALEVVRDPRHRQRLYATLSRWSGEHTNVEAARFWMAQLDPCAWDLAMDSEYRHSVAKVAAIEGDWNRVLDCLGFYPGDVPQEAQSEILFEVLRADAVERLGDVQAARRRLAELPEVIVALIADHNPELCPRALANVRAPQAATLDQPTAENPPGFLASVLSSVLSLQFVLSLVPGVFFFLEGHSLGRYERWALLAAAIVFPLAAIVQPLLATGKHRRRTLRVPGEVVAVEATGTSINDRRIYKIVCALRLPGRGTCKTQLLIPVAPEDTHRLQKGLRLALAVDPLDPLNAALA